MKKALEHIFNCVQTLSPLAQKAGFVRSGATEQRSLQSKHENAARQGADRVTLFRRSRFRSGKARRPQTAFAACPKRHKAKARHTGDGALVLAQKAGFVRSEATEQRSLQNEHENAALQDADRVTLFRRSRFRSGKARRPQTAFAACPKRHKAKARHTGDGALVLAQKAGFEPALRFPVLLP